MFIAWGYSATGFGAFRSLCLGGLVLSAACSTTKTEIVATCGPGTMLNGSECVIAGVSGAAGASGTTAGASAGGTAAASGSHTGGASSAGVTEEATGASGDSSTDPSGSNGGAGGAGAGGTRGTPTSGSAGTDAGGATGSAGAAGATARNWMVFGAQDGTLAYDLNRFPSIGPDAVFTLSASASYASAQWSPDGRHVAYGGSPLYVRDMGSVPGDERLIAVPVQAPIGVYLVAASSPWSGDSKSFVFPSYASLFVCDPSSAAPTLHVLTTGTSTFMGYAWAPKGDGLVYWDPSGTYFTRVSAGLPSAPVLIGAGSVFSKWAADGKHFLANPAGVWKIYDAATGTGVAMASPVVASPTVVSEAFNSDASLLAYSGLQARDTADIYLLALPGVGGTPKGLLPAPSAGTSFTGLSWHPDLNWLMYSDSSVAGSRAINVTGGVVQGSPVSLGTGTVLWVPHRAAVLNVQPYQLTLTDLTQAAPAPINLLATPSPLTLSNVMMSPMGTAAAWVTVAPAAVHIAALGAAPGSVTDVTLASSPFFTQSYPIWSADGKFMLVTDIEGSSARPYSARILRVSGADVSTLVTLRSASTVPPSYAFQPH